MTFSLKLYLNESILSKILFNEILNEPGGFFKYQLCDIKDQYVSPYKGINEYSQTKLSRIHYIQHLLNRIVSMFVPYSTFEQNEIIKSNNHMLVDGFDSYKMEQLHQQYLKYFNLFIKYFKNLFAKPEVQLFSEVVTFQHYYDITIDIQNITDYNFKKYTFEDIKNNIDDFMNTKMNNKCIFWFNEDKKFLGVTKSGVIKIIANDYITESMCHNAQNTTDDIMYRIKTKKVINYDGTVLEFPFTRYMGLHDGFIENYIFKLPRNVKYKKAGDPTSSVSNIRKLMGVTKKSYCYVYTPTIMNYGDDVENIVNKSGSSLHPDNIGFGFNEVIHKSLKNRLQHNEYTVSKPYTWQYDIYGKIIPYFSGPNAYLSVVDENGKLVTSYDHEHDHLYYDTICNVIRDENKKRYDKLVTVIHIKKDVVGEYEPKIRNIEKTIIDTNGEVIKFNDLLRDKFSNGSNEEQRRLSVYLTNFSHYIVTSANQLACKGFKCIEIYNELLNAIIGKDKSGNALNFSTSDLRSIRDRLSNELARFNELLSTYNDKKDEMYRNLNNEH